MARPLEKYTASGRIYKGPVSAAPDAGAVAAPYAALRSVAGGVAQVGESVEYIQAVQKQRQKEQDIDEATKANTDFTVETTKWQFENRHRTDFGEAYQEFTDELIAKIGKNLKSPTAAKDFSQRAQSTRARELGSALQVGESNRLAEFETTSVNATEAATAAFRSRFQTDPVLARELLDHDLNTIIASSVTAFGGKADKFSNALSDKAVKSAILGVAEVDPAYAKQLLDTYPIDESFRASMLNQVENSMRANNAVAQVQLAKFIEDSKADAGRGIAPMPAIPQEQFNAVFPDAETAKAKKIAFDSERDAVNASYAVFKQTEGKNLTAINRVVEEARKVGGTTGEAQEKAAVSVQNRAEKILMDDPAEYVRLNPYVASYRRGMSKQSDPELQQAFADGALALQMKFMGFPPEGTPADEVDYYMGMRSDQISALTNREAKAFKENLETATPQAAQQLFQEFGQKYKDVQGIAWRDIAKAGLGGEYQLAGLNRFSPELPQYLAALKNKELSRSANEKDLKQMESLLFSNETWKAFRTSYEGDFGQNKRVVDEFQNGVLTYALSLTSGSISERIKKSTDTLLGRHFAFARINDNKLSIPRYREAGQDYRGDADIAKIVSDLTIMEANVNVSQVSDANMSIFKGLTGDEQKRQVINAAKMLVPSANGDGVFLYVMSDTGIPVQIRDKKNRPFFYHYDDETKRNWPLSYEGDRKIKTRDTRGRIIDLELPPSSIDMIR